MAAALANHLLLGVWCILTGLFAVVLSPVLHGRAAATAVDIMLAQVLVGLALSGIDHFAPDNSDQSTHTPLRLPPVDAPRAAVIEACLASAMHIAVLLLRAVGYLSAGLPATLGLRLVEAPAALLLARVLRLRRSTAPPYLACVVSLAAASGTLIACMGNIPDLPTPAPLVAPVLAALLAPLRTALLDRANAAQPFPATGNAQLAYGDLLVLSLPLVAPVLLVRVVAFGLPHRAVLAGLCVASAVHAVASAASIELLARVGACKHATRGTFVPVVALIALAGATMPVEYAMALLEAGLLASAVGIAAFFAHGGPKNVWPKLPRKALRSLPVMILATIALVAINVWPLVTSLRAEEVIPSARISAGSMLDDTIDSPIREYVSAANVAKNATGEVRLTV